MTMPLSFWDCPKHKSTITRTHKSLNLKMRVNYFICVYCLFIVSVSFGQLTKEDAPKIEAFAKQLFDVGVAGIHRILDNVNALRKAHVIIVLAGMDGALASVVGGLVSCPVIAVPTSVGYGASFNGLAPLLSMLNSCATGVATVNIDNGFGAGCIAHKINLLGEKNNI